MSFEHFCTLFDSNFLPQGLALQQSLQRHCPQSVLWILCMDEAVEQQLQALALPNVRLLSLKKVENADLLRVKSGRSRGEYCWTLTPFLPSFVFAQDPEVTRVTYVDADLFFFSSPASFFAELEDAKKSVLITEHAYDPRYEQSETSGRFCVQFVTFLKNPSAQAVLQWWQTRCIEWCFARHEDGKFGDQKYLDQWPTLFGEAVHILQQKEKTQAPWNAEFYSDHAPVFFHFHGLRIVETNKIRLFLGYQIRKAFPLYNRYVDALRENIRCMKEKNIALPTLPESPQSWRMLRDWKRIFTHTTAFAEVGE